MLERELRDPDVVMNEQWTLRAHHSLCASGDRDVKPR